MASIGCKGPMGITVLRNSPSLEMRLRVASPGLRRPRLVCMGVVARAQDVRGSRGAIQKVLGPVGSSRRSVIAGTAAAPAGETSTGGEQQQEPHLGLRVRHLSGLDDPDLDTRLGISLAEEYEFSDAQGAVFAQLEGAMHLAAKAYFRMALADAILTGVTAYFGNLRVNGIADVLNNLTVAAFIHFGSFEFRAIYKTAGHDLRHLMRGLWSLVNVFQEVALLGCGVAMVQIATAGALWPYTSWAIGVLAVVATVARLAMFKKPELYDAFLQFPRKLFNQMWRAPHFFIRVSVLIFRMAEHVLFRDPPAARPVLAPPAPADGTPEGDGLTEYEFDSTQEQVVRSVVRALQMVTLVRLLQASADLLLAGVELSRGAHVSAVSGLFQVLETIMSGSLFYNCSRGLDRVQSTRGRDISNLLEGMGMQQGMGKLFSRVAHVLHIFIVVKLLTAMLPICEALVNRHSLQLTQQGLRHAWFVAAKSWLHVGLMFT